MTPSQIASRVVIYCRVSTADQAREGVSLDLQENRVRDYCRAMDLEVVEVIRDEGWSAKSLDRPGMARMFELIDQRVIDGALVYKLDRLTRSVVDFGSLLQRFEERNIALMSVRDSLDTSSAAGRLVTNIMLSVSQWEREVIGERTREALAQVKARGTHLGQPPVGYRVSSGRLVATERHRLVRRAHELRAGGMTLREIADALEQEGEVTGSGLSTWHPKQVSRLLSSPVQSRDTPAESNVASL